MLANPAPGVWWVKSRCSQSSVDLSGPHAGNAGSAGIAEKASRIVAKDLGMMTKILQLVNSAFFGLRTHVSDPEQAVASSVSIRSSRSSFSSQVFAQFEQGRLPSFLEALWRHAMLTGTCARRIAKDAGASQQVIDEAFTAALLHDVGVLVLAK